MTRLFYLLLGISFLLLSCKKADSDYRTSGSPIVMIRGFEVRNEMGQKLADIGNPDIHISDSSGSDFIAHFNIIAYPNPTEDRMAIYFTQTLVGIKTRLWIVPATFTGSGSEDVSFFGQVIIAPAEKPLMDTVVFMNWWYKYIQIRNLPEGYYRIYMKTDGILLWDNIVFSKNFKYD
jgi:hypothetical protein